MILRLSLSALLLAGTALGATPAAASTAPPAVVQAQAATTPVLTSAEDWRRMAETGGQYPMFAAEQARVERMVRAAMNREIDVPVPRDPGGGYTHEQHKRNYQAIYSAGALYRLTGDRAYADFARELLLRYADLYPTLGAHPAGRGQIPGRVFWQTLNDSVWLVYSVQGYDAIRETLSDADRQKIDDLVFRRMARFLSDETPNNFERIHNHATWAVAAVGMTGYVLRDAEMSEKALMGLQKDGSAGFIAQIDQLFSPDGYYEEGPYYQRYALAPFIIFARAIEQNDPARGIFRHRDGVLLKAVDTLVQSSYGGYFIPINDAILDKGLDTEELVTGVAIAYARSRDPGLLSIAERQGRTLLSPDGLSVAQGVAEGAARPFDFRSVLLRDGADGTHGGLGILRENGEDGQALVFKATAMGMGHGHFDKLNWLFYDNGQRVVTDYGAARFLNIEAKAGGIYLPENNSWAKTTVAHNTLVVNERNQFGGDWRVGEDRAPEVLFFETGEGTQIVSARQTGAYDGVIFTRTQALVEHPDLGLPLVIDLLRATGSANARYDLPLHYNGHIMNVGFEAQRAVAERPVLGRADGYQHLWVDASTAAAQQTRSLTWLLDGRFYTWRFGASAPSRAILAETGANDPDFNLRREPLLIQRVDGQSEVSFFGVLEPHGRYDGTAETVTGASSRIQDIRRVRGDGAEVIVLTLSSGRTLALGVADDVTAGAAHSVSADGQTWRWTGPWARLDR
ncbi:alginate lyase family protein [Brevundimonas sp. GCM10030266]|uniref:alginate lyase family protein n=1 Tax=Brevundimonas sp. GCM10030266 TaxID=3273386 RepID=UPI00360D4F4D